MVVSVYAFFNWGKVGRTDDDKGDALGSRLSPNNEARKARYLCHEYAGTFGCIDVPSIVANIDSVIGFANGSRLHGNIETPAKGSLRGIPIVRISGWAYSPGNKDSVVRMMCGCQSFTAHAVRRPDVQKNHADPAALKSGFSLGIWLYDLPSPFEIDIFLSTASGPIPIGKIHGTLKEGVVERRRSKGDGGVLLVTSVGRSGSTLLMEDILRHPRILGCNKYPFELLYLQQAVNAGQAAAEAIVNQEPSPLDPVNDSIKTIRGFLGNDGPERRLLMERNMWDSAIEGVRQFYNTYFRYLQSENDKSPEGTLSKKGRAGYYIAEKSFIGAPRALMRYVFAGFKEIMLFRNPADLICSYLAIDQKSGIKNFGNEFMDQPRKVLEGVSQYTRIMIKDLNTYPRQTIAIKYEDLIKEKAETADKIFGFLGLAAHDRANLDEELFAVQRSAHFTSVDGGVGRADAELDSTQKALVREYFGELCDIMGYTI